MQLKEFYDMQHKLNIEILYNLKKRDLECSLKEVLNKTIVALVSEIGEFSNEIRTFKFWSTKPDLFDAEYKNREKALSEYADVMHFFLSLGLFCGFTVEEIEQAYLKKNDENFQRQKEGY